MERRWIYLINPILNATDNSYRMAVRITTYHFSALTLYAVSDPVAAACLLTYASPHNKFIGLYNDWVAQGGLQEGESLNLRQLLRLESSSKAAFWDSSVQIIYPVGTPRYTAIFPNRRIPLQQGTQTQRISAVSALSDAIGADAALATVKTDVDTFYALLNAANIAQKGSKVLTKGLSNDVEANRVAMCEAQYSNLGAFIKEYSGNTTVIDKYFDLEALRKGQQVLFEGHVKKNSPHTIVKHTFGIGDQLKLENPGVTKLSFYLAAVRGAHPGAIFITLDPGTQQTVLASALGSLSDPYLMVFNPDLINKGQFVVEMV